MHGSRTTALPQEPDPFGTPAESRPARTVWFHRSHGRLYGGHIKHSHYFGHVARMTGFRPKISFSGEEQPDDPSARECRRLWPDAGTTVTGSWDPATDDVLFLACIDTVGTWPSNTHSNASGRASTRFSATSTVSGEPDDAEEERLR